MGIYIDKDRARAQSGDTRSGRKESEGCRDHFITGFDVESHQSE
jgi:hypothetical protein